MALCFDLDGTLGHFGGGYQLLREALGHVWGQEPTREQLLACAGSTDWEIVGELHAQRFGTPLSEVAYAAYTSECLQRFRVAFAPEARQPTGFGGLLEGLHRLVDRGHRVWLVSGNAPGLLDFKAEALGIDPRIPRLGSLPGFDRAALIREALRRCGDDGPHPERGASPAPPACACGRALYVGDRPWDRDAAALAGVPFLGIGAAWTDADPHPRLGVDAEAEALITTVEALVERKSL